MIYGRKFKAEIYGCLQWLLPEDVARKHKVSREWISGDVAYVVFHFSPPFGPDLASSQSRTRSIQECRVCIADCCKPNRLNNQGTRQKKTVKFKRRNKTIKNCYQPIKTKDFFSVDVEIILILSQRVNVVQRSKDNSLLQTEEERRTAFIAFLRKVFSEKFLAISGPVSSIKDDNRLMCMIM